LKLIYFSRDHTVHDQRFLDALAGTGHQVGFLQLEKRAGSLDQDSLPQGIESIPWAGGREPYHQGMRETLRDDLERVINNLQPDLVQAGPLHLPANLVAHTGFSPLVSMSWGYDLLYDAPRSNTVQEDIRFTLNHSAAMVGDCNTIRKLAVSYGMPDERIVTFPWGVDLELYKPPVAYGNGHHPGKAFTLLSTRGWEPIYGVDVIARAFVLAAQQQPQLRLVMLGNGSLSETIQCILQNGGVMEKVSFPGQIPQAELPAYYGSADLYLSASHSDGTSISLLEALACGTPTLISDIPGNREWVEPGVQGWWYPDGDAEALAAGILAAYEQRLRLPEMGLAARQLAEERADWQKNFPELFKAYRIALN
jgi:glycosyltransferase involved in cell wall biosynthesis